MIALKCDLRGDPLVIRKLQEKGHSGVITYDEGLDVAKRIRATRYLGKAHGLFPPIALD
jgi:Rho family protein